MPDLKTSYMGLKLKNPVIVGSCGLTNSVQSIVNLQEHGAGAVILKSLFEEQILAETDQNLKEGSFHAEASDYLDYFVRENIVSEYLKLIREAKSQAEIPIIASINCITPTDWTQFATEIENAGADGLELNIFILPSDPDMTDLQERYFNIIRKVRKATKLPLAVKVSYYFSNLAGFLREMSHYDIQSLVLFNRFYNPDIDIDREETTGGNPYSTPEDIYTSLRWVALTSHLLDCDVAATTGIHDGAGVVKQLLAGANAIQMVSSVYKNGPKRIMESVQYLENWMSEHKYDRIDQFRGKLSKNKIKHPAFYERAQFLKHFGQV